MSDTYVKCMDREFQPHTLRELFEKDEDDKDFIYFNSKNRDDDTRNQLKYRIPEHQRFPQWNKEDKKILINTIFKNYPISSIIVSEKVINGTDIVYDIEDGQTRLSILQEFYDNNFTIKINDTEKTFNELTSRQQNTFLDYKIIVEIIKKISTNTEEEFNSNIHDVFERLQKGKTLGDPDKLWNRKNLDIVQFAIQIIEDLNTNKIHDNYNNELQTKNFGTKKRGILPDIVGMILGICYMNSWYESHNNDYLTAYRFQIEIINRTLTSDNKKKIKKFLKHYINIIHMVNELEDENAVLKIQYFKCNKIWGTLLLDYLNITKDDEMEKHKKMWIFIINTAKKNKNFFNELWYGLAKGDKQNTTYDGFVARLERYKEFYKEPEKINDERKLEFTL